MIAFLLACSSPSAPVAPAVPAGPGPGAPAAAAPAAAGHSLALSGTIAFTGPVTAQALFVSVRDPANPGPPLAAKKLPPGPFPLQFTLTDADIVRMGPDRPVPEKVSLVVRLDGDGDAMSKDPADPNATLETASSAAGLAIELKGS